MNAPFGGLRVLEFGGGAAGPVATRYLADHGATVIRVESRERPDFLRTLTMRPDTPGGLDGSLHFAILNANKLSVAINMSLPEGVAIARRLALAADVVAENFSPKAMAKWGLDWDSLSAERPDLVMISTCLYGQTGPERMYAGFGGQGSAIAGFNHLTGWPDLPPNGPFGTITDSLSPRLAAVLVAAALWRRAETGQGQYVDLSQVETGVYCLAEAIVAQDGAGVALKRIGNRSREAAPHGVFPCRDEAKGDRWVTIVCADDEDWRKLRAALGDPAWASDARFATVAGRRAAADEIERRLSDWTREHRATDIAERLQAAGVESHPVADFEDLHADPQLAHRGHFRWLEHPVVGRHAVETDAMRFSASPGRIESAAPRLGEHTGQVLRDMLGMSDGEIRVLEEKGVLR
jgi:crotonobetainyl-CoA:carnitine CoA-transferase CaiB-like acyl-CoA transferase